MERDSRDRQERKYRIEREGRRGGEVTIRIRGRVALDTVVDVRRELDAVFDDLAATRLDIDLSGITFLDSAGALAVFDLERRAAARSVPVARLDPSPATRRMMALLDRDALEAEPFGAEVERPGMLVALGRSTIALTGEVLDSIRFSGELLLSAGQVLLRRRAFRWREAFSQLGRVGMDGLPLVGVISFLFGVVVALMSLNELQRYGAVVMLPTVVAMAMVKQFGPLMTAILVAGRSGSAFAAEIATMRIDDEISALRVFGLHPVAYLALPRVAAAAVAVPLLAVYGTFAGILGGMFIGVGDAGMSFLAYVRGIPDNLTTADALTSLVKAGVFGALIGGVGCQRGFRARAGAGDVGACTTSAVVSGIFLIIFMDAVAAFVISRLGL